MNDSPIIRWLALPAGEIESVRLAAGAGHGQSIIWWIAAAVLVALGSSMGYVRRRPLARRWAIVPLVGCRSAALAAIVLMLADVRAVVQLNRLSRPGVWLLIDGSHRFEVALLDFVGVDRMLKVGGHVAIDDVGANVSSKEGLSGGPNRVLGLVLSTDRYRIEPWSANVVVCEKRRDA